MAGTSATGALLAAGLHAAAGGSGFGRAVAGTGPVFLAFLAIHVPAGRAAMISGAGATAPKRHGRHTRTGTIYYWAIVVVFAIATAMAAIRPARDWYLALPGALAFALAAFGRDYRRQPWRRWPGHIPHILAMGGSYTVLLTALAMGGSYTVLLTAFYADNGKNLPLWDRLPAAAYWDSGLPR
jgi:hypothetical protein